MVVSPAQFPTRVGATGYRTAGERFPPRVGATGYRTAGGNRFPPVSVPPATVLQVEIEGNTTRDLLAFPTQETP